MNGPLEPRSRVTEKLRPVVESLPTEAQLPFLAALERGAAARYRSWADAISDPDLAEGLRACATREEHIATRIETLVGRDASQFPGLDSAWAEVREIGVKAFAERPLAEQLATQANAERGGAAAWRELASDASPQDRAVFEACAGLEEVSAAYLEKILSDGRA